MSKKRTVLVATVGTRDLAYQVSSQEWLNVGNYNPQQWDSLSHAVQVELDLETDPQIKGDPGRSFRSRTQFFSEHYSTFQTRLKPIILGSLLEKFASELSQVYLIATNQLATPENRTFREKDTLYCAQVIASWIQEYLNLPCRIILLGEQGENPADFDSMIRWTKQHIWQSLDTDLKQIDKLLISPKGGVGQLAEALRVTALSHYTGQKTLLFCDFNEDESKNLKGEFSALKPLSQGEYYLWELSQRQAIALLDRYDYAGVQSILRGYWKNSSNLQILKIKDLLEAALRWNIAEFKEFSDLLRQFVARHSMDWDLSILDHWWWLAYESAYLSVVRFDQGHTIEALFHSFRAVEGLISEWAIATFLKDIEQGNGAPRLKQSIDKQLPGFYDSQSLQGGEVYLYGTALDNLLLKARPEMNNNADLRKFFDVARKQRNQVFHRLLGLKKEKVFLAWDTGNKERWQSRVLGCLNCIAQQSFNSLEQASLMPQIHKELRQLISTYRL